MYHQHSVAVVIPIHNEENFIATMISSLPQYIDLIIAVDDGSCDNTVSVIRSLKSNRLKLIQHSENRGVGAATISGYLAALQNNLDIVVVMDGDGQMHPHDLPQLLDAITIDGYDYVKGNRFLHHSVKQMPWMRFLGNKFFSTITKHATGLNCAIDTQCGYTAITNSTLRTINLTKLYPRYGFLNELLFRLIDEDRKIGSVPVHTIYGDEISGINPLITVPTICYLIARGYWQRVINRWNGQRKRSKSTRERALALTRFLE